MVGQSVETFLGQGSRGLRTHVCVDRRRRETNPLVSVFALRLLGRRRYLLLESHRIRIRKQHALLVFEVRESCRFGAGRIVVPADVREPARKCHLTLRRRRSKFAKSQDVVSRARPHRHRWPQPGKHCPNLCRHFLLLASLFGG